MSNNQVIFTARFAENCSPADSNDGSGLRGQVPVLTAQSHLRKLAHRAVTIAAGLADCAARLDDQGKTIWSEVELAIEPGATPSLDARAVLFDCLTRPIFACDLAANKDVRERADAAANAAIGKPELEPGKRDLIGFFLPPRRTDNSWQAGLLWPEKRSDSNE